MPLVYTAGERMGPPSPIPELSSPANGGLSRSPRMPVPLGIAVDAGERVLGSNQERDAGTGMKAPLSSPDTTPAFPAIPTANPRR